MKNKHPKIFKTLITTMNGSTYLKNWILTRKKLKLEVDYSNNLLWRLEMNFNKREDKKINNFKKRFVLKK